MRQKPVAGQASLFKHDTEREIFEYRREQAKEGEKVVQRIIKTVTEKDPKFIEDAISFLKRYPHDEFIMEDVRLFAEDNGMPEKGRSWGAVAKAAQKQGLVVPAGSGQTRGTKTSHRTWVGRWRRLIPAE